MDERDDRADLSFTTHVDLAVAPREAWDLIGDSDALGRWLGGELDLVIEPGAEGTMNGSGPAATDDDLTVIIVEEVTPGERLALRWASASKAPTSVVFEIVPRVSSTRIVITESAVPQGLAAVRGRLCAVG
jgi:uncharacterized protein YndB with AHSA1/START domain